MLEVSWPLRYHHNRHHPTDAHSWSQRSRFLAPDVRALCEEDVAGPPLTEDEPVHVGAAVASVDALLDDLWR